jgi:phospholipase C
LTEARHLVLEMNGYALTNPSATATDFTATASTSTRSTKTQRWVLNATGGTATDGGAGSGTFTISSALDGRYINSHTSLGKGVLNVETYMIADLGNNQAYTLAKENVKYLTIDISDIADITRDTPVGFQVFSVTIRSDRIFREWL